MATRFEASFFDGHSARDYRVQVTLEPQGLIIRDVRTSVEIGRWGGNGVRRLSLQGEARLRLTSLDHEDQRLVFDDWNIVAALEHIAPDLERSTQQTDNKRLVFWCLSGLVGLALFFWVGLPAMAGLIAPLIPLETEKTIGKAVSEQFEKRFPRCTSGAGDAALQKMLAPLIDFSGLKQSDIKATIVNSKMVNAFALPGGYIFVMDGLLQKAESPQEVAGVLAHELGHVKNRHAMEGLVEGATLGVVLSALLGDVTGSFLFIGAGEMLLHASYTREKESEADNHAFDVLQQAGIGARGFAKFFDRLAAEEKKRNTSGLFSILSTHPPSEDRAARAAASGLNGSSPISAADWRALKSACSRDKPATADQTDI